MKRILVGWLYESSTQNCWDSFGWWPLRLSGKSLWLNASKTAEVRPCPLLMIPWHLPYNWRKARKTCQGSWIVGDYSLRRLGRLFRDSLAWPAEHQSTSVICEWLQSALGWHKCLPRCRTNWFLASVNIESKLSVSALMWSSKNGIPKSSWICLLPTYEGALVAMRRRLDCKTAVSGRCCGQRTSRSDMRNPSQDGWAACRATHPFWGTGDISC
jgi:hypothetical protein